MNPPSNLCFITYALHPRKFFYKTCEYRPLNFDLWYSCAYLMKPVSLLVNHDRINNGSTIMSGTKRLKIELPLVHSLFFALWSSVPDHTCSIFESEVADSMLKWWLPSSISNICDFWVSTCRMIETEVDRVWCDPSLSNGWKLQSGEYLYVYIYMMTIAYVRSI